MSTFEDTCTHIILIFLHRITNLSRTNFLAGNARTRRPAAQGMRLHATETTSCDMGGSSSSLVITRCARNQGPPMDCDTYIERPLNRRASCAGTSNAPGASSTVVLVALGID